MNDETVGSEASLRLYNTATKEKMSIDFCKGRAVRLYTCGPTVYNFAHIGNFRTYVFEDILRRTIQFFGYDIMQVMNITDVDDKTIRGAIKEGLSLEQYVEPYKRAFFEDLDTLNIQRAEKYPAATEYIEEMIEMIDTLIDKGVAYRGADGSVYFSIEKFPHYGCLSHLKMDELKVGASQRTTSDEYEKENLSDFVLWKAYEEERDGEIYWESPFGKGRPGWHLECSTMAMKLLGETLDIHCGGIDNMFPHHENEIAQSEACSGKTFSRLWMHSEHLIVNGKKMAKSAGNFYTLRDLLDKGFTGREVRYLLMQTHYKTQLNFTFDGLEAAKQSLQRLDDFVARMRRIDRGDESGAVDKPLERALAQFTEAMGDDLNISAALAALYEMVREVNSLADRGAIGAVDAEKVIAMMRKFDAITGVIDFEGVEEMIPDEIYEALQRRIEARENRNWSVADELRDFIHAKGFVIEDTPSGAVVKKGRG